MKTNVEGGCFVKECNQNSEIKKTLYPIPSTDSPMNLAFAHTLKHSEYRINNALPKAKFIGSQHFNLEGLDNVDKLLPTSIPTLCLCDNESNDYSSESCVCKEKENCNENILMASENLPPSIFTNVDDLIADAPGTAEELYTLNLTEFLMHPNTNNDTHKDDEPSPKRLRLTVDPTVTDNFPTQEDTDSILNSLLKIGSPEEVFLEGIVPYSVWNKDDSNKKLNMKYRTRINHQMEKIRKDIQTLKEETKRLTDERMELLQQLEDEKNETKKEKVYSELSLSLVDAVNKCDVSAETIMFANIILGIQPLGEPEYKMCSKLHNSSPTTYTYMRNTLGFNNLPFVEYDEDRESSDFDD